MINQYHPNHKDLLKEDGQACGRTKVKKEPPHLTSPLAILMQWIPQPGRQQPRNKRKSSMQKDVALNVKDKVTWCGTALPRKPKCVVQKSPRYKKKIRRRVRKHNHPTRYKIW